MDVATREGMAEAMADKMITDSIINSNNVNKDSDRCHQAPHLNRRLIELRSVVRTASFLAAVISLQNVLTAILCFCMCRCVHSFFVSSFATMNIIPLLHLLFEAKNHLTTVLRFMHVS